MNSVKKFRWAWMICLLLLAGFLVNSISNYLVSRNNIRKTIIESSLPLTSDNIYSEIQRDLLRPIFISSLMAQDTFLRDWVVEGEKDPNQMVKFLHEIKFKYGTVTSFFVSDKTHNYYHADGVLKSIDNDDPRDQWYFRVKQMSELYEINVDPDLANKDAMTIFINYRVFDFYGNFIGATGVGLTVTRVNELISDYETRYNRQIYFAKENGEIILMTANGEMNSYGNLTDIPGLSEKTESLLSGAVHKVRYVKDRETRFLNCRYVAELGWFLIVEQAEDAMMAPLRRQLRDNILLALLITIVVAGISVATIKRYSQRLENRNDELKQLLERNSRQQSALETSSNNLEEANLQLSELLHEKDEIISLVAHDLRNPLNGMLGLADLAESDPDNFEWKEFISDLQTSGQQMNTLIQNLLSASQLEAGHSNETPINVNLQTLIQKSIDIFKKDAQSKHITMNPEILHSHDLTLNTHPDWLSICLNNLLSNAIKYTPRGGTVVLRSQTKDDQKVHIDFIDSGPGISDEDQSKLFQKFERLSARPTAGESSTGLGLYLVKKTCDRIGIEIGVDSQLGDGARFTLSIPL